MIVSFLGTWGPQVGQHSSTTKKHKFPHQSWTLSSDSHAALNCFSCNFLLWMLFEAHEYSLESF
jgi:hypothetical protein